MGRRSEREGEDDGGDDGGDEGGKEKEQEEEEGREELQLGEWVEHGGNVVTADVKVVVSSKEGLVRTNGGEVELL